MRNAEITPSKIRGRGNLMEQKLKTDFTTSGCVIDETDLKPTFGGVGFNAFRISVPTYQLFMNISASPVSINPEANSTITATLEDVDGLPVANHSVIFQEKIDNVWITLGSEAVRTDVNGVAEYVYTSNTGGTKTIRAITYRQGEYGEAEKQLTLFVYIPTNLVLSPSVVNITEYGMANITATLKNSDSNALISGRNVDFINNNRVIGSALTNSSGVATLNINASMLEEESEHYFYYDDMSTNKTSDYVFDSNRSNFVANPPTITLVKNPDHILVNLQKSSVGATGESYYLIDDFASDNFTYTVTIEKTSDFAGFSTVIFNETKDKAVLYQFSGSSNVIYMGTMSRPNTSGAWTLTSIGQNTISLTNGEEYIFELIREDNTVTSNFIRKTDGTVLATRSGTLPAGFTDDVHIGMGFCNFNTGNNNLTKTLIKEVKCIAGGGVEMIFLDDCTGTVIADKYTATNPSTVEYTTLTETINGETVNVPCIKTNNAGRLILDIPDVEGNFEMYFDMMRGSTSTTTNYLRVDYYEDSTFQNGYASGNTNSNRNCVIHKQVNGTHTSISSSINIPAQTWVPMRISVVDGVHTLENLNTGEIVTANENTRDTGSISLFYTSINNYIKNIIIKEA